MTTNDISEIRWSLGLPTPGAVRQLAVATGQTGPTRRVWRGTDGDCGLFKTTRCELKDLMLPTRDGDKQLTDALEMAACDGFIVVHRGQVLHEQYFGGIQPHQHHINTSMAKVYVGMLTAILMDQGHISRDDPASKFAGRLSGSGFSTSTVDDLLNMTSTVSYNGRPYEHEYESRRWWAVLEPLMRPNGYDGPRTIAQRLNSVDATDTHGDKFLYENGNCETLAQVVRTVTGSTLAQVVSDLLWTQIGAQEDAMFMLDEDGVESACGGFASTLRDTARLGELVRNGGARGGKQVLPATYVDGLWANHGGPASRVRFPREPLTAPATKSYRDYWWVMNDEFDSILASGIHGQQLLVSQKLELVIAKFSSQPLHMDPAATAPLPLIIKAIARTL